MNNVQMFWYLCVECVEFLSQMRSGAVLMESRHGEGQTDKQGLYQRKKEEQMMMMTMIHLFLHLMSKGQSNEARLRQSLWVACT